MISPRNNIIISPVRVSGLADLNWDVLRLDLVHPVVSGNKIFKLGPWLQQATQKGLRGILTFGGPWSNHIVACAFAARELGLQALGMIRGERPDEWTATLREAIELGMELRFLDRTSYRKARENGFREFGQQFQEYQIIPEGGYGIPGAEGAEEMLRVLPSLDQYTHVVCACGTGTMLAGLIRASVPEQKLIGVDVVGQGAALPKAVIALLPSGHERDWITLEGFDRGGYARYDDAQIKFMETFCREQQIPSDIVYTGKLFLGIGQLIREAYFPPGSRILAIHSGGLQGNRSLSPGTISF